MSVLLHPQLHNFFNPRPSFITQSGAYMSFLRTASHCLRWSRLYLEKWCFFLSNLERFILIGVTGTGQAVSGTPKYIHIYMCPLDVIYIICTSRYAKKKGVFNLIYNLFICYDWSHSLLRYEFRPLFYFDYIFFLFPYPYRKTPVYCLECFCISTISILKCVVVCISNTIVRKNKIKH